MRSIVEGSNSADAISPLDGGAGILLLRLGWMLRSDLSTDANLLFCLFFLLLPKPPHFTLVIMMIHMTYILTNFMICT